MFRINIFTYLYTKNPGGESTIKKATPARASPPDICLKGDLSVPDHNFPAADDIDSRGKALYIAADSLSVEIIYAHYHRVRRSEDRVRVG